MVRCPQRRGGKGGRPRNRRARRRTEISNIRTARREAGQMSTVLTGESARARARDVRLAWFHYKNVTHRAAARRAAPPRTLSTMRSRSPLPPSLSTFLFSLSFSFLSLRVIVVTNDDETREAVDLILSRPSINARPRNQTLVREF